jgi:DNA-binding NtrC family response regulator
MSKKILIIDDEIDLCKAMVDGLNEYGYKAYAAYNGKDGLDMIAKVNPGLLLLDIRLPGMGGIQVMREIMAKFPNLVVVVMTGFHDIDIAKKAIDYGACEYLTKPVGLEELIKKYIRPILGD